MGTFFAMVGNPRLSDKFVIIFQSLVHPAITGAEDGVFPLEGGTEECIRLNRLYDGKVNHFLVPAEQLKRPSSKGSVASLCVAPPGDSEPVDAASNGLGGGGA